MKNPRRQEIAVVSTPASTSPSEHAAAAEDVSGSGAEQQQPAERQRVAVLNPGQRSRGGVMIAVDRPMNR